MRELLLAGLLGVAVIAWHPAGAVPLINYDSVPQPPSAGQPDISSLQQGYAALSKGELSKAETAFEASRRADSKAYLPLLGLAEIAMRKRRFAEVESWLRKAQELDPKSSEVQTAMGRYHFTRGTQGEAEKAFRKAIELDPRAFYPRVDLAELYMAGRKPDRAAHEYRAAVEIKPRHGGAHYGLGVALYALGKTDEAIQSLQRAASITDKNPLPHHALGEIFVARRQYDDGLRSFELAAQRGHVPGRVSRGDIFAARGKLQEAVGEYEIAIKEAPKYGPARLRLGMIYQRQERWAEAESVYLKLIEIHPNDPLAYNNLAWMAAERKVRLDDALVWATKAVHIAPQASTFLDTLAWVRRARGELTQAAEILRKAAALKPPQAEIHYHLGIVESERGNFRLASAAFNRTLAIDPGFGAAADVKRRLDQLKQR